jgi:hypothetical protein
MKEYMTRDEPLNPGMRREFSQLAKSPQSAAEWRDHKAAAERLHKLLSKDAERAWPVIVAAIEKASIHPQIAAPLRNAA